MSGFSQLNPVPVANGGTGVTTSTGTVNNVLSTSPTLVTPVLGAATATSVTFSPTTGGIVGTTTNDSTSAGNVGEYISATLASGSATSITNNSAKTIISVSLTAGDWDVMGGIIYIPAGTTSVTNLSASVSQSNNTLDQTDPESFVQLNFAAMVPGNNNYSVSTNSHRISLSGTTTVYLVAYALFSISTMTAWGKIWARRRR